MFAVSEATNMLLTTLNYWLRTLDSVGRLWTLETIATDDHDALDFTVGLLDNTMARAFAGDAVIVRNEIQRVVVLTLMARSAGFQSRVATGIFQGNTTRILVQIRSLRKAHMLGQKFTSESPVGFR